MLAYEVKSTEWYHLVYGRPFPEYRGGTLEWGKNMTEEQIGRLQSTDEQFLLYDAEGKPYAFIMWDYICRCWRQDRSVAKFKDIADLSEDDRIKMIGTEAMKGLEIAFVVDDDGKKADRYISKLLASFPQLKVIYRHQGPTPGAYTVKVKLNDPIQGKKNDA